MANPQIENGHLDLANEIVDVMAKTQLSGYESRILWVVWRRTYCWHKKDEVIKFDCFRELTGLVDSHISRTIKKLVGRNILTKKGNKYSFQKNYQKWDQDLPKLVTNKDLPKMVSGLTKIGNKTYQKSASTSSTKETYKRNLLKETKKEKQVRAIALINPGAKEIVDYFLKAYKLHSLPKEVENLRSAQNLLASGRTVQSILRAIDFSVFQRDKPYALSIGNVCDLERKIINLENKLIKEKNGTGKRGASI